jgi:hypothetical protein
MLVLTHSLTLLSLILIQATPEPSPLRVAVVGNPKAFWPETLVEWAGLVSALAILAAGIWALKSYREAQRLKASEILLSMEQEFRIVLPTYELIENPGVYETRVKPLLKKTMDALDLTDAEIKSLSDLDRCLRFLFLCSVLNRDLAVEHNALMRAYYHYVSEIAKLTSTEPPNDLANYIKLFYPSLCSWIEANRQLLADCRAGKPFAVKSFWKSF